MGVSVLTAIAFVLDKKTAETVVNLAGLDLMAISYKNADKGRGEGVPIVYRIEAFAYVVCFLATVAIPVQGPKKMDALQRLQPLKPHLFVNSV